MWSVGVIAYELLMGRPAFESFSSKDTVIAALVGEAPLPWESASAADLKRLLKLKGSILQCLSRDPEQRPTAVDFAGVVEHTFLPAATTTATHID